MDKKELLALCRYFRGEDKCPFEDDARSVFWLFESMFVENASKDPVFLEGYKNRVTRYIEANPGVLNDLTSDCFAVGTRAIILYCEDMLRKWRPYDVDLIFKYGNV